MARAFILGLAFMLNGGVLAYAWNAHPEHLEFTYFVNHWTARFAAVFYFLAYIARPLFQLTGYGRYLLVNRRYIGLASAISITLHLIAIIMMWPHIRETWPLLLQIFIVTFGGIGFLYMFSMAATSNNYSQRRMGPNWRRLHKKGMNYLWGVFLFDFSVGSMLSLNPPPASQGAKWKLIGVALLLLGFWMHMRLRKKLQRAT